MADRVVATIFVNPLQFGANEDLAAIRGRRNGTPKCLRMRAATSFGFRNRARCIPPGFATNVSVKGSATAGKARRVPVTSTVSQQSWPNCLPRSGRTSRYSGKRISSSSRSSAGCPRISSSVSKSSGCRRSVTNDGLALSSRNAYLSAAGASTGSLLYRDALKRRRGAFSMAKMSQPLLEDSRARLGDAGFSRIDYFALVNALHASSRSSVPRADALIAAAVIGRTRLIDNIAVGRCDFGVTTPLTIYLPSRPEVASRPGGDFMGAISQKSADFLIRSRLADADRGNVDALFELGVTYSTGRGGIAVDLIEAHNGSISRRSTAARVASSAAPKSRSR